MTPANGQTITVTRTLKDVYGNPVGEPSSWTIANVVYWQDSVSYDTTRRNTSIVIGYVSVPRGSDIQQADAVILADEREFQAMDNPEWDEDHPLSGADFGYMAVKIRGVF